MTHDLTVGKPLKNIILLTLPIMFGNLFQQLYSVVDSVIVGRIIGSNALAAVGATASVNYLIMWFVNGMANGYAVVIAQIFGAGQTDRLKKGVCTSLMLSGTVTAAVTFISLIFIRSFLSLMNTPSEIMEEAYIYISIIIAGMLACVFYNTCAGILRAMGDGRTPLYFLVLSSFLNIILDILFIKYANMGVAGAALATVISQIVSGILCFTYMYARFPMIRFNRADWIPDIKLVSQMLSYGIPGGLNGAATAIGILILQFAINCYGTDIIAGYTAAMKVQNFAEVPFTALAIAMVNYEGQNLGAGKKKNMIGGYMQCIILGTITALICGMALFFMGHVFIKAFLNAAAPLAVSDFANEYLKIIGFFFIPYSILCITRSSLQGMGDKMAPLTNAIVETTMRILFTLYLMHNLSSMMLCMVSPITWSVAAAALILMMIHRWSILKRQLRV